MDNHNQDDGELPPRPMPLVPPLGFAMVVRGVYRYTLSKRETGFGNLRAYKKAKIWAPA
jgi:hypothetical protein